MPGFSFSKAAIKLLSKSPSTPDSDVKFGKDQKSIVEETEVDLAFEQPKQVKQKIKQKPYCKNFTILLFTLFSILVSFSYANQTLINQQNAQRFLDSQLQGQLEVDRQRREREAAAAQQYQEPRDDRIYHRYAVFVWDENTGYFYGFPEILVKPSNNSKKAAVKLAKKEFNKIIGDESSFFFIISCIP